MQKSLSLLEARKTLSLTQVQMAEMLDVTAEYVSMIEHGKKDPSRKLLNKLGALLERKRPASDSPEKCPHCAKLEEELREARAVIRDQASALASALAAKPSPVAGPACGAPGAERERKRA